MDLGDFDRVADAALQSIETLLFDWFPNGAIEGREFCIGSKYGEAGKSMRICLSGDRAGRWAEFSIDGEAGRDLISLYAYIHGISQGKACARLADELGITLTDTRPNRNQAKPREIKPPQPEESAPAQAQQGVEEKKPRTEWEPVLPVPEDAGPYPVAHIRRGRSQKTWEYRDQERRLLGVIHRFTTSDGGKEVLPCVYARHPGTGKSEWRWISFRDPRPLYLPAALRPDVPALVVEGEKCADAAHALIGDEYDVVSWPGGGKAVQKADWSPLAGRRVILWADCDAKVYKEGHPRAGQIRPEHEQPGVKTMLQLAEILKQHGSEIGTVEIPLPGEKPDGWDVADLIDEGATRDDVLGWVTRLTRPAILPTALVDGAEKDEIPAHAIEGPDSMTGSVEPLRLVHSDGSASTPRGAGAGPMTRRQVRAMMIPGAIPGSVRGCRENVYIALKHDPMLLGMVALDQFSLLQVKRKNPPWRSESSEWTEGDDFLLGMYLFDHYGLVISSVGDIEKGVAQAARENGFNPVVEMFEACAKEWDGIPRVENAFTLYWGAPESDYMRAVSRMFFVGLAKRAYCPGVKHDNAPVFEGKQGEGKSTALKILGGDWFADTPFGMGDKDGFLSIQGILIYEIAELEQFNRSEVTAVKAFMSSQTDRYREPYGRRMKNQPRRTCFGATTNEGQYFKDATGNRRFHPIDCGTLDLEGLRRDRNHLLGEAAHMMRDGVLWYPTRDEQQRLIAPMQESREMWDEWSGRIWEYLEGIDSDGQRNPLNKKDRVTARELITRALHIEIGKISQAKTESTRVGNVMRKFGWIKKRETDGAREYYYERPKIEDASPAEPSPDQTEDADDLPI